MTDFKCVGCQYIRDTGGGHWHDGEPHYVGCPTELAELRRENKELREQVRTADGVWAGLQAKLALWDFKSVEEVFEYTRSQRARYGKG